MADKVKYYIPIEGKLIEVEENVYIPEDLEAINTVSRIRKGKNYPYIEKSKAVFVTTNTVLIVAIKEYLKNNSIDVGFPLVVSSEDLCVMAWLKEFEHDSRIPKMRLLTMKR